MALTSKPAALQVSRIPGTGPNSDMDYEPTQRKPTQTNKARSVQLEVKLFRQARRIQSRLLCCWYLASCAAIGGCNAGAAVSLRL